MAERYQQFLGSKPGLVVELLDDASSPFRVRGEDGFEYFVSAEDFRNYYKKPDEETASRWRRLVTDPESGMVDCGKMAEVMSVVQRFADKFQDFDKARAFVGAALRLAEDAASSAPASMRKGLKELGWESDAVEDSELAALLETPPDLKKLLQGDTCAVLEFSQFFVPRGNGEPGPAAATRPLKAPGQSPQKAKAAAPQSKRGGMKNVEMTVDGDTLTLAVDLSKEFGPSKSGKTIIIASTEGNKSVPGRNEKVGMNIYRQEGKKSAKGRKTSFNNVEMDVHGDLLSITVDLSKEAGPSKSGKTIIIASTEGNQLVFGREEKIGLNVYRKIE